MSGKKICHFFLGECLQHMVNEHLSSLSFKPAGTPKDVFCKMCKPFLSTSLTHSDVRKETKVIGSIDEAHWVNSQLPKTNSLPLEKWSLGDDVFLLKKANSWKVSFIDRYFTHRHGILKFACSTLEMSSPKWWLNGDKSHGRTRKNDKQKTQVQGFIYVVSRSHRSDQIDHF